MHVLGDLKLYSNKLSKSTWPPVRKELVGDRKVRKGGYGRGLGAVDRVEKCLAEPENRLDV